METIPTLWEHTKQFMADNKELVNHGEDSLLPWITDNNYTDYNGCHFWSNFEVISSFFYTKEDIFLIVYTN